MKLVAEVKTQTIENGFVILVAPHISPAAMSGKWKLADGAPHKFIYVDGIKRYEEGVEC